MPRGLSLGDNRDRGMAWFCSCIHLVLSLKHVSLQHVSKAVLSLAVSFLKAVSLSRHLYAVFRLQSFASGESLRSLMGTAVPFLKVQVAVRT